MPIDHIGKTNNISESPSSAEVAKHAGQAFVHELIESPVNGATQFVEHCSNGKIRIPEVTICGAPPPTKEGSLDHYAVQAAGAVGMIVPFLLVHKGVETVGARTAGMGIIGSAMEKPIVTGMLSGAVYGGVFKETPQSNENFWSQRGKNAVVSAATFGTLEAAPRMVGNLCGMEGRALSERIALGAASGLPAGLVNAEASSLVTNHRFASGSEIKSSIGDFAVMGGLMPLIGKGAERAEIKSSRLEFPKSDEGNFGSGILRQASLIEQQTPLSAYSFKIDPETGRPAVDLYVTSNKDLKVRPAVDYVVGKMKSNWSDFSEADIRLHALKTDSGIGEQPIGTTVTAKGAEQRAQHADIQTALNKAQQDGTNAVVVSFENGIEFKPIERNNLPTSWLDHHGADFINKDGNAAVDFAIAHVEAVAGGHRFAGKAASDGVLLPFRYVEQAREVTPIERQGNGYDVTAGGLMSKDLGVSGDNWHQQFTGVSRIQYLNDAVHPIEFIKPGGK